MKDRTEAIASSNGISLHSLEAFNVDKHLIDFVIATFGLTT